jgi:hypothetical protein
MQLVTDLQKVKRLIEAGWMQGDGAVTLSGVMHHCLVSAISYATDAGAETMEFWAQNFERFRAACKSIWTVLLAEGRQPCCNDPHALIEFNDAPGRTKDEVIHIVNQAIGAELRGKME